MNYPNCPIVEVVVDFRISNLGSENLSFIADIFSNKNEFSDFSEEKKLITFQNKVNFQDGRVESSTSESAISGVVYSDKKNKQVQVRLDGISFHHLNQYGGWDDIFPQALLFWNHYKTFVGEKSGKGIEISRLAVRTINKINLPLPISDFDDYLTIVPKIPSSLPQSFNGLFSQIQVPVSNDGSMIAIINQTFDVRQLTQAILPYILDIDVIHQQVIPKSISEVDVESVFNSIHEIKNSTFESCITDKARELFK